MKLKCDNCLRTTVHHLTKELELPFCSICCRLNDEAIITDSKELKKFRKKERKGNDTVLHNAQVEHYVMKKRARIKDETDISVRQSDCGTESRTDR